MVSGQHAINKANKIFMLAVKKTHRQSAAFKIETIRTKTFNQRLIDSGSEHLV